MNVSHEDAIEHIKLYFEKKGYRLDVYESPNDITWSLFSNLDRITFGFINKKDLKIYEYPIPYEKIYANYLSNAEFPIYDYPTLQLRIYNFPKYFPIEKFCLLVDLMPYDS